MQLPWVTGLSLNSPGSWGIPSALLAWSSPNPLPRTDLSQFTEHFISWLGGVSQNPPERREVYYHPQFIDEETETPRVSDRLLAAQLEVLSLNWGQCIFWLQIQRSSHPLWCPLPPCSFVPSTQLHAWCEPQFCPGRSTIQWQEKVEWMDLSEGSQSGRAALYNSPCENFRNGSRYLQGQKADDSYSGRETGGKDTFGVVDMFTIWMVGSVSQVCTHQIVHFKYMYFIVRQLHLHKAITKEEDKLGEIEGSWLAYN